jgi:hypothetical protein
MQIPNEQIRHNRLTIFYPTPLFILITILSGTVVLIFFSGIFVTCCGCSLHLCTSFDIAVILFLVVCLHQFISSRNATQTSSVDLSGPVSFLDRIPSLCPFVMFRFNIAGGRCFTPHTLKLNAPRPHPVPEKTLLVMVEWGCKIS